MVFGVLPHPGVTVVDVDGCYVIIGEPRKDNKPLGEEIGLEAIAGAGMGQVHHYLVRFGIVGLEGEQHMVDEQVSINLASFEPEREEERKMFTETKQVLGKKMAQEEEEEN